MGSLPVRQNRRLLELVDPTVVQRGAGYCWSHALLRRSLILITHAVKTDAKLRLAISVPGCRGRKEPV